MRRTVTAVVYNQAGVLSRITSTLNRRQVNIESISVGTVERKDISRMTISFNVESEADAEQVIKQLNRCVVVIKVIDFTEVPIHKKELLYIKVSSCSEKDKAEVFRLAKVFSLDIIDYDRSHIIVQCVKTEDANNDMIALFNKTFINRVEVVRGGSVAIEAVSTQER